MSGYLGRVRYLVMTDYITPLQRETVPSQEGICGAYRTLNLFLGLWNNELSFQIVYGIFVLLYTEVSWPTTLYLISVYRFTLLQMFVTTLHPWPRCPSSSYCAVFAFSSLLLWNRRQFALNSAPLVWLD